MIFSSSFGYLDTYIEKFYYQTELGDNSSFGGGREAAMSPNTASISFEFKPKNDFRLSIRTNFKGQYYFSDSHNKKSDSYSISNLILSKGFGKIKLTLWGNNIFDKRFATRGFILDLYHPTMKMNYLNLLVIQGI